MEISLENVVRMRLVWRYEATWFINIATRRLVPAVTRQPCWAIHARLLYISSTRSWFLECCSTRRRRDGVGARITMGYNVFNARW